MAWERLAQGSMTVVGLRAMRASMAAPVRGAAPASRSAPRLPAAGSSRTAKAARRIRATAWGGAGRTPVGGGDQVVAPAQQMRQAGLVVGVGEPAVRCP